MTVIGYAAAWLDPVSGSWHTDRRHSYHLPTRDEAQREVDAFTRRNPGIPARVAAITIDDEEVDR